MAKLRSVSTAFWSDPFIEDLSPKDKLLFLYLVTNEKTNMLGVYEASLRKISFETGLDEKDVINGLKGFERLSKVKYINNYVFLVNFMKHQKFNTNMKKSAIDIYNSLPNSLKNSELNISKSNASESFETLLNRFGMVPKREVEVETKKENEDEAEKVNFGDSLHNVDLLKIEYIKNESIVKAVISEPRNKVKNKQVLIKYLDLHCSDLKQQGRSLEKWSEFTRYFINSLRSGKFLKNTKPNNSNNGITF